MNKNYSFSILLIFFFISFKSNKDVFLLTSAKTGFAPVSLIAFKVAT